MAMRDVRIQPVSNGFIVTVGCQTLVYNDIAIVAAELIKYQQNPDQMEKEHYEKAINKDNNLPQPCEPARVTGGLRDRITRTVPDACEQAQCEEAPATAMNAGGIGRY